MNDFIQAHSLDLYALSFWGGLVIVATWEALRPRRSLSAPVGRRWAGNTALILLSAVTLRLLVPVSGVTFALAIQDKGWGLLNFFELPDVIAFVLGFLLLDFARYGEHRLVHKVPVLWRLHRLHHTDHDVDCMTQLRAHPIEVLVGALMGICVIALLGPPILTLIVYDLIFAAQAFWTHSNVSVPTRLDAVVRRVFTTPDVHRVHHSVDFRESNSNFGSMFTLWDRLLGTFVEQPALGHENMVLGLEEFEDPKHQRLTWMLMNPLLDQKNQKAPSTIIEPAA